MRLPYRRWQSLQGGTCLKDNRKEQENLDKADTLRTLICKLNEAEVSVQEDGTISADELELELEI